jgi:mono/diheme cytochrome c family protein
VKALDPLRELAAVASVVFLLLLVLSGWALMTGYVPSEREAFDSVLYLRQQGAVGPFLRSLHHWLASGLVASGAAFFLLSVALAAPAREAATWWAALLAYALIAGSCFTGFLLPMDQNALWGTIVRLGIIETIPAVGGLQADFLRGGPALNASTLTRFYALHAAILPALLLAPLGVLAFQARGLLAAPANARRVVVQAALVLATAYLACGLLSAPLEPRASLADTDYVPGPEWYFLWLFQLGKYVESMPWVRSLVLPAIGIGALVSLPWWPPLAERTRVALVTGAALAWAALTGLALFEDRFLPPRPSYEQALAARADGIYREECRSCHGAGGRGDGSQARTFGLHVPDFTSADFWAKATDDRMRTTIRNGKGKDMPAFGRKLSAEEIDALVALTVERYRFQASGGRGAR